MFQADTAYLDNVFDDEEAMYSCTVCNKTFMHERTLKRHMAVHNPADEFICGDCGKQYTQVAFIFINVTAGSSTLYSMILSHFHLILHSIVFNVQCYASMFMCYGRVSVCPSFHPSQASVLSKWLNISHKQCHMKA